MRRESAPVDRRVKLVLLTDQGRDLLDTLRKNSREFNQRILTGIPHQDVLSAIDTLDRIKGNLVRPDDGDSRSS